MKPHHGEIYQIPKSQITEMLRDNCLGHLGCNDGSVPYVVPITYVFEDSAIYCHSRPGKKIELMRKNPNVCLQVDKVRDFYSWKSVVAWGKYKELSGDEASRAMRLLIKKLAVLEEDQLGSPLAVDFEADLLTKIIFKIDIKRVTGVGEG